MFAAIKAIAGKLFGAVSGFAASGTLTSWPVLMAGAVAIYAAGYTHGHGNGLNQMVERADAAAEQVQVKTVEVIQYVDRVVTEYRDREVIRWKQAEAVIREVPVYVTQESDRNCVVPDGFVRVHDAAANQVALPAPAAGSDPDADSGVALSTVAGTVAENYAIAYGWKAQLDLCQAYVSDVHHLINDPGSRK